MKRTVIMLRTLVALAVAVWTLATCEQDIEPMIADVDAVEWVAYENRELGIRLEHPARWRVEAGATSIRFEGEVATAMRVTLIEASEAEDRGLWGRTPVVRVDTAGVLAYRFYRYRHYDGPAYVPTLAFVVPHRGVELGVEFRTRSEEPGPVEHRILGSLRLD